MSKKVLVFDPSELEPIVIESILSERGVDFKIAKSLEEAMKMIQDRSYDILLFSKGSGDGFSYNTNYGVSVARRFRRENIDNEIIEMLPLNHDDKDIGEIKRNKLAITSIKKGPELVKFLKNL